MSLQLLLTKAWQENARWLVVLRPLSWLYGVLCRHQKNKYLSGKCPQYRASVPVLVIGNIAVGGSGKTPFLIGLIALLKERLAVGVISRGYGGQSGAMPCLVDAMSDPSVVGDEPVLIARKTGVPLAVSPRRQDAIECLLQAHPNLALIVSDDGLQHYALYRDAEWIVVDEKRQFGRGHLLPEGFLREPVSRLEGATVIWHTQTPCPTKPCMSLVPQDLVPLFGSGQLAPQRVYAVTGIGYPKRFFETLRGLGFQVVECAFDDHHAFVAADFENLQDLAIVTTEKDAVKLLRLDQALLQNCFVLPIQAVFNECLFDLINDFGQNL